MGSWKWILIRIPLIFFAVFTFSKWMLWNFYGTKAVLFLLKGPYPLLRQFGSWAIWGCVCLFRGVFFSEEAFAFAILWTGTSCCMLAVCARLLCMHSWSCVCMLALYTGLLHIQTYCVCMVTVYVWMLCMHNYYVCTLAMHARLKLSTYACLKLCTHAWGWGIPGPIPLFPVVWGRSTGQGCTSTQKVSMHRRCGCYTV